MVRSRRRTDERGEVLPAAILFVGVILTVLIGVHVVLIALARTAVQAAAEAAVVAAQAAGPDSDIPGSGDCDDTTTTETARQCEGIRGARVAMAANRSSITETQQPVVSVPPGGSIITVFVRGGTISPILGGLEFTALACGPLDDVPATELASMGAWQC